MHMIKIPNKNILVRFNKTELNKIMLTYSKKISLGEWKDYSISFEKQYALFCIYKNFQFRPTFSILKSYKLRKKYTLRKNEEIIKKTDILNDILSQFNKPKLFLVR